MRGFLFRRWLFGSLGVLLVLPPLAALQMWDATHCSPYDAAAANLHALDLKIQAFALDTGRWPRTLLELLVNDGTRGWNGPYARERELKDPWGEDVQYVVRSGGVPVLSAHGRNRRVLTHQMEALRAP